MKKASKKTVKAKAKAPAAKKAAAKRPAASAKKSKNAPAKKLVGKKSPAAQTVAKTKSATKKVVQKKTTRPTMPPAKPAALPTAPAPAVKPAPVLTSSGQGTWDKPWILKTPAGFSEFQAYRDESGDPPAVVIRVGSTELRYHLRSLNDLVAMLKAHGDWMPLGSADEQQAVIEGTVESWARSPHNPVGGWYGLRPGLRGRFATYIPQVLEVLGLVEVEHFPNNNRMRAK